MQADLFPRPGNRTEPRYIFWSQHWTWPESPDEFCFLGEAVHMVGKLIYGEQWSGDEPLAPWIDVLPEFLSIETDQRHLRYACLLLVENSQSYRLRCVSPTSPMPTADEWAEAVVLSKQQALVSEQAFGRFLDVCRRLTFDFRRGHLLTALRPFGGGTIEPVGKDGWNTENWMNRFFTCQIDVESPFSPDVVPNGGHYIFVERSLLVAALNGGQTVETGQGVDASEQYFSPYMQCMIKATIGLGLTADIQPKKEVLMAALPDYWDGDKPLNPTETGAMATLMRAPERKLGRGWKAVASKRE